jgi:hypothetical protein
MTTKFINYSALLLAVAAFYFAVQARKTASSALFAADAPNREYINQAMQPFRDAEAAKKKEEEEAKLQKEARDLQERYYQLHPEERPPATQSTDDRRQSTDSPHPNSPTDSKSAAAPSPNLRKSAKSVDKRK